VSVDVIVVGAGLTGLVAAYRLQRSGRRVAVLEAADRAGGVISTRMRDQCLFELGPNSALDSSPAIGDLLEDLGIRDQRIDAQPAARRRYVVRGGQLVALPHSAGSFITSPLFTLRGKLRLLAEPFVPAATAVPEESVSQFVARRLGPELLDAVVEPFVSGIYAGDPAELSVAATFPRLYVLEQRHGSLTRGAIARLREPRDRRPGRMKSFSFRGGMRTLTDALAQRLPGLECGVRAVRVVREGDGFAVETAGSAPQQRRARAVVLALPAHLAAPLVERLASDAASALAAIPYAPIAVVAVAYRRSEVRHPLDGFGFLAPSSEGSAVLGTLFSSTMFEGRAPADRVLLTSFVGGRRNPTCVDRADADLAALVKDELARLLGSGAPLFQEIQRWPHAIPQYTFGHRERVAVLENTERAQAGLLFCGNYRGGVSIGDCIVNGAATAERLTRDSTCGV